MLTKTKLQLPQTMETHSNIRSSRSATPIAFFFVAIISFLFGVISNGIAEFSYTSSTPWSITINSSQTLNQWNNSDERVLSENMSQPLGLRWFQASYENPWQFSVMRTGIPELHQSFKDVMSRDGRLPRVVVSFTSLPRRFTKYAYTMLRLIKDQSYIPDVIYVAVPKTSRRSKDSFAIPTWLRDDPLVKVLRPDVDYGPATKLIPALEAELALGHTHSRIVTVDDDNEGHWGRETLLQLVAYSLHFEDAVIGLTGWNVTCMVSNARCAPHEAGVPDRQFPDRLYNFIRPADDYACHSLSDWLPEYFSNCMGAIRKNFVGFVDVLEGYRGVLYQPRFFDVDVLKTIVDPKHTPEYFLLSDDVWFSGWLSTRNVSRLVVSPAIHDDAPVRLALVSYSDQRAMSRAMLPISNADGKKWAEGPEKGLHDLGNNFVQANHDGVRWFEKRGGWTPGIWDMPDGSPYMPEQ